MRIERTAILVVLPSLFLILPAGATDYGMGPAIVPLTPALFLIALSIIFCRWALGESKGSPRAMGYWVLFGITGLIGAIATLTLAYWLLERGHWGEFAAVFGVSLFIGLIAALLFVGVLRMLGSLLRLFSGSGVKEKNSAADA